MWEIVQSGGWIMFPLLACSVIAIAITMERFLALQMKQVAPSDLFSQVIAWKQLQSTNSEKLSSLAASSPLGLVYSYVIKNLHNGRKVAQDAIEEAINQSMHDMERYLTLLGVIAAITPLLGLLGTVIGMIKVFTTIVLKGTGDATLLASGISEALVTTATGLLIAIPALTAYRLFLRRIEELTVHLEKEGNRFIDALFTEKST